MSAGRGVVSFPKNDGVPGIETPFVKLGSNGPGEAKDGDARHAAIISPAYKGQRYATR